jgi:hypothetical protein
MSHFYIEPRYNSGERVAGGTLAIYADETMQSLLDLWAYADLQEDGNGGGRLANPLPIDNNGINSSPVFADLTDYPSAYYAVRDARQAIVRQGYVVPMSWQGGAQPPPGGGGGNWNAGDPFWGYQVATVQQLAGMTNLGRPLFVSGIGAGDKSGGLVVWETPGSGADNALSFQSGGAGTVWRAREEFINYSYLAQTQPNSFGYIDGLNAANGWNYGIRLDAVPMIGQINQGRYSYKSRLLIDSAVTYASWIGNATEIYMKSENLITAGSGSITPGSGVSQTSPFIVHLAGGDFFSSQVIDGNGNNWIKGDIGSLTINSGVALNLTDLNVGIVKGSVGSGGNWNQFSIANSTPANSKIKYLYCIAYSGTSVNASDIAKFNVDYIDSYNTTSIISLDNDIRFEVKGNHNVTIQGINNQGRRAYYIKPSNKRWVPDMNVIALNADFYNGLAGVASNVGIVTDSSGNVTNNLLRLGYDSFGNSTEGTVVLDSANIGKLYIDTKRVNVVDNVSKNPNRYVWAGSTGKVVDANIRLDARLATNSNTASFAIGELANAGVYAGSWTAYNGKLTCIINHAECANCSFNVQPITDLIFKDSKVSKSSFSADTSGYNQAYAQWEHGVGLGNNSAIEGSTFSKIYAFLHGDQAKSMFYSNINFNNNRAINAETYLSLMGATTSRPNELVYSDLQSLTDSIQCENVCIKGNKIYYDSNDNAYGFIVLATSGKSGGSSFPFIKGHIEITGEYDYSLANALLATGSILERGINFNYDKPWNDGGEYIANLCLYGYGETLKYGNRNDGVFVMMDYGTEQTVGGGTIENPGTELTMSLVQQWMGDNGGLPPGMTPGAGSTANPIVWANTALPGTLQSYLNGLGSVVAVPGTSPPYYTVTQNDTAMANVNALTFPYTYSGGTNALPAAGSNFGGTAWGTQLLTDFAAATGQALPELPTGNAIPSGSVSNYPCYFAWTSDGYLIKLQQAIHSRLGVGGGTGTWVNFWGVQIWSPALPGTSITVPGETATVWKNNNPIPKMNMSVNAWDGDGNGYTKVINCLLCCNCNVNLYRIRE